MSGSCFMSLLHSVVVWLFDIWQVIGNSVGYFFDFLNIFSECAPKDPSQRPPAPQLPPHSFAHHSTNPHQLSYPMQYHQPLNHHHHFCPHHPYQCPPLILPYATPPAPQPSSPFLCSTSPTNPHQSSCPILAPTCAHTHTHFPTCFPFQHQSEVISHVIGEDSSTSKVWSLIQRSALLQYLF